MDCANSPHHYFVADVAVVPAEGKVVVIAICTACADVKVHHISVCEPHTDIHLEKKKENTI